MARRKALGPDYGTALRDKVAGKQTVTTGKGPSPQKRISEHTGRTYYKPLTTREKYSVYLAPESIQRVKDAVSFLMGDPAYLTVSTFFEQAIQREVERLAQKHHGGKPFPHVQALPRGPRPGRPAK